MKRFVIIVILLFIVSLLPAIANTCIWSSNIYGLIVVATSDNDTYTYNPYAMENDTGFVSPDFAMWILLNTGYPYDICVNTIDLFPDCGSSPIIWAGRIVGTNSEKSTDKSLKLIDTFIQKGLSIDVKHDGLTAIHESILFSQPKYLSILLINGADPYIPIEREGNPENGLDAFAYQELLKQNSNRKRYEIDKLLRSYMPNNKTN